MSHEELFVQLVMMHAVGVSSGALIGAMIAVLTREFLRVVNQKARVLVRRSRMKRAAASKQEVAQ